MDNVIHYGEVVKINVHIEPIDGLTMDDYNFEVEAFTRSTKSEKKEKRELVRVDENNYVVFVDSEHVGRGSLQIKVTAWLPDADYEQMYRKEIEIVDSGMQIV